MPRAVRVDNLFKKLRALDADTISLRQLALMDYCVRNPGQSVRHVAADLGISKPACTRACNRLIELRWLERKTAFDDRRCVILKLTEVGKKVLYQVTDAA